MAYMRVEIYKGKAGWRFRLVGANGEKVTQSEAYTRKASAKRGARRAHPLTPIVVI